MKWRAHAAALCVTGLCWYAPLCAAVEPPTAATTATAITATATAAAVDSTVVALQPLPAHGRVRFELTRGNGRFVAAEAVHEWRHDGRQYELHSLTDTVGLVALFRSAQIDWRSQGRMTAAGLQPVEFSAKKRGQLDGAAQFDWAQMRLQLSGRERQESRELALLPASQDLLSMFYQLAMALPSLRQLAEPRTRAARSAATFVMPVTNGRKLLPYQFEVKGEENLQLPRLGTRQTLHVHTRAGEQLIDIWLDVQLHGLPVKIRYTDNKGDAYDQTAVQVDVDAAAAAVAVAPRQAGRHEYQGGKE